MSKFIFAVAVVSVAFFCGFGIDAQGNSWSVENPDGSYRYTLLAQRYDSMYAARDVCVGMGMRLLSIESEGELDFLRSWIADKPVAEVWTSGIDLEPGNQTSIGQYWIHSGKKINPCYWAPREPNDNGYKNREICVTFAKYSTGYFLNDFACSNALHEPLCKVEISGKPDCP